MDAQKVDMFIMSNGKFFESHQVNMIRERLVALDDSKWVIDGVAGALAGLLASAYTDRSARPTN